jgi:hypothetical protein
MRNNVNPKEYVQRIFLFTTNDNPIEDEMKRKKLVDFVHSLQDKKIVIEVFPLIFGKDSFDFKVSQYFLELIIFRNFLLKSLNFMKMTKKHWSL